MGLFSQEPPKEDLTVSEKFQLVLDVAQKAQVAPRTSPDVSIRKQAAPGFNSVFQNSPLQNLFGKMADVLEKIKK